MTFHYDDNKNIKSNNNNSKQVIHYATHLMQMFESKDDFSYVDSHLLLSESFSLVQVCEQFASTDIVCKNKKSTCC